MSGLTRDRKKVEGYPKAFEEGVMAMRNQVVEYLDSRGLTDEARVVEEMMNPPWPADPSLWWPASGQRVVGKSAVLGMGYGSGLKK